MSADSPKKFIPDASQGDYWGGYMVEGGTVYNLIVAFLGLLGFDKIALRSPLTAAFKFIVNVSTLWSWWFYDMIQTYSDKEFVTKYGYSTPFGPDGHGYNMVSNMSSLGSSPLKPSGFGLFLYYIYVISCLVLPFGLGNIIAGDVAGGIAKLISCMAFITIPVYIIMGYIEFATSGTIEQKGVPRTAPIYPVFMLKDRYPASNIIPDIYNEKTKTYIPNPQIKAYYNDLSGMVWQGKQPYFQGMVSSISKGLGDALNNYPPIKAFNTVSEASETVKAVGDITKAAAAEFKKNPKALLSAIGVKTPPTPTLPTVKLSEVPLEVPNGETFSVQNPLLKAKQTGGGLDVYPEMDNLLMGGMAALVIGGLLAVTIRKLTFSKKTDDNEYPLKTYDRDDTPPVPGGV